MISKWHMISKWYTADVCSYIGRVRPFIYFIITSVWTYQMEYQWIYITGYKLFYVLLSLFSPFIYEFILQCVFLVILYVHNLIVQVLNEAFLFVSKLFKIGCVRIKQKVKDR